jgi:hypothetical protein
MNATLSFVPEPVLPAHPGWLELYWRAWELAAKNIRPGTTAGDFASAYLDAAFSRPGQQEDATIQGLWRAGEADAARKAAARQLDDLAASYRQPDLAGWTEPSPIALLIGVILGIEADAPRQAVRWQLREAPPCGLRGLHLGQNTVSLVAQEDAGGGLVVEVEATQPFLLEIETEFTSFVENMPPGSTRLLLTHLDRTDIRTVE